MPLKPPFVQSPSHAIVAAEYEGSADKKKERHCRDVLGIACIHHPKLKDASSVKDLQHCPHPVEAMGPSTPFRASPVVRRNDPIVPRNRGLVPREPSPWPAWHTS